MFECEIVEIEDQQDDCLKANKLLWDALPICDDGVKFINVEKQLYKIVLNESVFSICYYIVLINTEAELR